MDMILPEIDAVGIYNSQIAAKNKTITKNRKTTMFEIEIPIEEGGISYINSEEMHIVPDIVICAKPGQIRHTRLPFKCYYIHMILNSGTLYDILTNVPVFIETKNSEEYRKIFEGLCGYFDSPLESDRIMAYSLILKLIYLLNRDSKKQLYKYKLNSRNYEIIENVIKYIKENLTSDLSLNAVASYASLSPIHFHNCFKAATGKTLHEYVEEQRIKKAAGLLVSTDLTLTEISYECGFSSQSYFSYAFKRKKNMTPREYAKEIYRRYDT